MIKKLRSAGRNSARAGGGSPGRTGRLAIELLLVLPVLLAFLLGMIEFSMMLIVRQELLTASREGARVAALGGTADEVDDAARRFLGAGSLAQANVESFLTDDTGAPLPSGSAVVVTVSIPAGQAIPDLLAFIGLSIRKETLAAQSVMRKE